jgi:hypothetical protein
VETVGVISESRIVSPSAVEGQTLKRNANDEIIIKLGLNPATIRRLILYFSKRLPLR